MALLEKKYGPRKTPGTENQSGAGNAPVPTGLRLKTDRLVMRAPGPEDVDRLTDLIGDYEVTKWLAQVPWPYRRDHALEWLAMANDADSGDLILAIDNGEGLIGGIGLASWREKPTIGYWLGKPYWAQGFMSEAVEAMLAFAFEDLDATEIFASVFDHNIASLRLQERFGFKVTGRNLDHSLARGNAVPGVTTVLTRDDFETFRDPPVDHSLVVDDF